MLYISYGSKVPDKTFFYSSVNKLNNIFAQTCGYDSLNNDICLTGVEPIVTSSQTDNDDDGIMLSLGDNRKINITTDGHIIITDGISTISLIEGKINIGKDENLQPVLMGQDTLDVLKDLGDILTKVMEMMVKNPYVSDIGSAYNTRVEQWCKSCDDLLSGTVNISK